MTEVLLIADAAGESRYFDRKLDWLQSALRLALTKSDIKIVKRKINDSKRVHDRAFKVISTQGVFQSADHQYFTKNLPYKINNQLKELARQRAKRMLEFENNFENLIYTTKSKDWNGHDLMFQMKINLRRQVQKLCKNEVIVLYSFLKI